MYSELTIRISCHVYIASSKCSLLKERQKCVSSEFFVDVLFNYDGFVSDLADYRQEKGVAAIYHRTIIIDRVLPEFENAFRLLLLVFSSMNHRWIGW